MQREKPIGSPRAGLEPDPRDAERARARAAGPPMVVGFLAQGWAPDVGGVETHALDLARELAARGDRVRVLCLDYGEGKEPYATDDRVQDGVSVRRMAYRYHDQTALADVVRNPRAEEVVRAWLAEASLDVVHVHHATGFGLGALRAVREAGRPLVMTLHDYWALCPRGQMLRVDGGLCRAPAPEVCGPCIAATWPHLAPSGGGRPVGPAGEPAADDARAAAARTAFALEELRLAHRLIAPSEAARAVYVAAGVDPARIAVVENGVDADALARAVADARARAEARPAGEVRLGVLGSVLPSKGVLELARALVSADAPGLVLEVHGNLPSYHGDRSYVDALLALAAGDPRVRVRGPYARADLPAILAGLDGVAAPSRWEEVFGLTVREAAAAGLPVLVSDAGGLPALARGGRAGLVVPRDDARAWAAALERFARDADARRAWAGARPPLHTAARMAAEIAEVYAAAAREAARERSRARGFLRRLFGRG